MTLPRSGGASGPPRALITGGAGFVGSHLCRRLIGEGVQVICLDNLLTGSRDNLQPILGHPDFTFSKGDVTKPVEVEGHLDAVIHFASLASPPQYAKHPIHTLKTGSLGTYHTLGLAKGKGARFLLASSSEIYGDPEVNPQPESYWGRVNPVGPRSVYDEAKRFAEALAVAYWREHGVDVRIARLFNTYGPQMHPEDGRAIPTFMVQALRGEPLTVYGDGSQTRSLSYVDDIVEGLYRLLTYQRPSAEKGPLIVNLGNPEEVTILELAHDVIKVTGSRCTVTYKPLPEDDPKMRRPDITAAKALLGWEPRVPLAEGLQRVLPYFQQVVGQEVAG